MKNEKKLLEAGKRYFFCVFYGIHIETIDTLKYKTFDLKAIKLFSLDFNKLLKELPTLGSMQEELEIFKHYQGQAESYLFYSEKEDSIDRFYDLLILLVPSRIGKWLEFDTYHLNYESDGIQICEHQTNGFSIWEDIQSLFEEKKTYPVFLLTKKDCVFVNKLMGVYTEYSQNNSFKQFMGLFKRAYLEKTDYFKFLLFFMIVESLIKDDETSGTVYKIRRLCAVLAGGNEDVCQIIFDKVKYAYNVRSKLVHSAVSELHKADYLMFLQSIVCELGIMVLIAKLNTNDIFRISNKLGFGQKSTLIKDRLLKSHSMLDQNCRNIHHFSTKKKKPG